MNKQVNNNELFIAGIFLALGFAGGYVLPPCRSVGHRRRISSPPRLPRPGRGG